MESFIDQRSASARRQLSAVAVPSDQMCSITTCSNSPSFFGGDLRPSFIVTLRSVTHERVEGKNFFHEGFFFDVPGGMAVIAARAAELRLCSVQNAPAVPQLEAVVVGFSLNFPLRMVTGGR